MASKLEKPITCTLVIPYGLKKVIQNDFEKKGSNFSTVVREILYKHYKYGNKTKKNK